VGFLLPSNSYFQCCQFEIRRTLFNNLRVSGCLDAGHTALTSTARCFLCRIGPVICCGSVSAERSARNESKNDRLVLIFLRRGESQTGICMIVQNSRVLSAAR
jgi:hypothetical protein